MRFSIRTPVCTRSISSFGSSAIVPMYHGTKNKSRFDFALETQRGLPVRRRKARSRPPRSFVYNLPSIANQEKDSVALDDKIYQLRQEKLKQIEALGQPTYRSKYEFTHTAPQILA